MKRRISVQFCLMTTSSSELATRLSSPGRIAGAGGRSSQCAAICCAAASPNTKHSSSELDARRLAPCSRSEVRRGGNEWVSECDPRWRQDRKNKKTQTVENESASSGSNNLNTK